MKTSTIGFPRIGEGRELKKALEAYFEDKLSKKELIKESSVLKEKHWKLQNNNKIDYISSNDFSLYDNILDTYQLFGMIPDEYNNLKLDNLETYIALARGYQKNDKDIKSLEMKKWFNTNYHYVVPVINDKTEFKLTGDKIINEYLEAKNLGIETKPVITGPFTFLKLSRIKLENKKFGELKENLEEIYIKLFERLNEIGVDFLQLDEPYLVRDLSNEEKELFLSFYETLLNKKGNLKILIQTYFGDIRDIYNEIINLDIFALGLDFIEGSKNLELIKKNGFPKDKHLFAGLVNGKNIWRNDYKVSLETIKELKSFLPKENIIINTSCSLLHVPYTTKNERKLDEKYKKHLVFAREKLEELTELGKLADDENYKENELFLRNQELLKEKREAKEFIFADIRDKTSSIKKAEIRRKTKFETRNKLQKELFDLPILPTTTIGSFPQTLEIRKLRRDFKNKKIDKNTYESKIKEKIQYVVKLQEDIEIDVLVHGEYERNDMVEYFGENLTGYIFTENAWVQSYGTRGVKPPIIFSDIKREQEITVGWTKYAQSQTDRIVKGMLTGPVTMLAWSFPREDITIEEIGYQLSLAIQEEVLDLEKNGIKIIQIDEPALREKLPLRNEAWDNYLEWAAKIFRYTNNLVKDETQIHTHMCYSEFENIIDAIIDLDSDVITIETAKSDLSMLDVLRKNKFPSEVGPGVFDIHTPRIPEEKEIKEVIDKMISKLDYRKLWVNPDCGLKTRTEEQVEKSLRNMVKATKLKREELTK